MQETESEQMCSRYIENLHRVRELAKPKITPDMSREELLETIQHNAAESFARMKEDNAILEKLVFSHEGKELSDADVRLLTQFAGKLFNYNDSDDNGIAYKIHCLLLDKARRRNDEPMLLRELYYCGLTLYYIAVANWPKKKESLCTEARTYFQEAASYLPRLTEFDNTSQGFILRCLGNCKMRLPRHTKEEVQQYYRVWDDAMAVFTSPEYRKASPDLPWDSFVYAMNLDQLTIISYLNGEGRGDMEVAQRVLQAAEEVYRYHGLYHSEEARLQNSRIVYFYDSAMFVAGKETAYELEDNLLKAMERMDLTDYSSRGINLNLSTFSYILDYLPDLNAEERSVLKPRIQVAIQRGLHYIEVIPPDSSVRVLNMIIKMLAQAITNSRAIPMREMFSRLLTIHQPTLIHSRMVGGLTRELVHRLVEVSPEALVGVQGCETIEQVQEHDKELCALAYECGLYHDIGKNGVIMYVGANARRLLDEEFTCIKEHPEFGYYLLCRFGREKNLAQAARYHHCFYNGKGGYPSDCPPCPPDIKPIVDAITVADSMDAATDGIGRCYTVAKSYEKLVEELYAGSGTRYSPTVVALLDDADFRVGLKRKLYAERENIYDEVYRGRQENAGRTV